MELLLREPEALEAMRISRTTLWRLRREGQLRPIKIGRSVRYPAAEVRRWVDEQMAVADVEASSHDRCR
jgi:excisionase family DNA binding protein